MFGKKNSLCILTFLVQLILINMEFVKGKVYMINNTEEIVREILIGERQNILVFD